MRRVPFLFLLAFACSLATLAASLWWTYGGESPLAAALFFVGVGVTGLLAFGSGLRGEHQRWKVSAHVRGVLTALIVLGATLAGTVVVNFQTTPGLDPPTSKPTEWPALVQTPAEESGNGTVVEVLCDRKTSGDSLGSCAVTFEGPRCQYWFVGNQGGQEKAKADDEIIDGRAIFDPTFGVLCPT